MDTVENEPKTEKVQKGDETKRRKFTSLVFLACILSAGSLIWTTYSLLDYFQIGGLDLKNATWEDVSIIGLSAAATADIAWSVTMIAEYRGVRIMVSTGKDGKKFNALPYIGWAEVLFVTFLLFQHGKGMGDGQAAFAAALPILTKLSWIMALADLKDPAELSFEAKERIAERRRKANEKLEEIEATAASHAADMEALRRRAEAEREEKRVAIEKAKMEQDGNFELKQAELEGQNRLETLETRLKARLQIEKLESQQEVQLMRINAENNFAMAMPFQRNPIVGEVVRQSPRRAISGTDDLTGEEGSPGAGDVIATLMAHGLKEPAARQARLALSYYTVNASLGRSVTKKAFCAANGEHAPRLSEATRDFPESWFEERGLATWTSNQN